jgi:hypothetical protein
MISRPMLIGRINFHAAYINWSYRMRGYEVRVHRISVMMAIVLIMSIIKL